MSGGTKVTVVGENMSGGNDAIVYLLQGEGEEEVVEVVRSGFTTSGVEISKILIQ